MKETYLFPLLSVSSINEASGKFPMEFENTPIPAPKEVSPSYLTRTSAVHENVGVFTAKTGPSPRLDTKSDPCPFREKCNFKDFFSISLLVFDLLSSSHMFDTVGLLKFSEKHVLSLILQYDKLLDFL